MRVPLIGILDTNISENDPFPAIDSQGRILPKEGDGDAQLWFKVDKTEIMDQLSTGKSEISFSFDEPEKNSWEILLTDTRIAVLNSFTKGLIGKPKAKPGKVSAGHLHYKSVTHIGTWCSNEGIPFLACRCYRFDGTRTSIVVGSGQLDKMREFLNALHEKLSSFIRSKNLLPTDEKYKDAITKWDDFPTLVWKNQRDEISVAVPNVSMEKVRDSRVS